MTPEAQEAKSSAQQSHQQGEDHCPEWAIIHLNVTLIEAEHPK
jgi:hypothetical protein